MTGASGMLGISIGAVASDAAVTEAAALSAVKLKFRCCTIPDIEHLQIKIFITNFFVFDYPRKNTYSLCSTLVDLLFGHLFIWSNCMRPCKLFALIT